MVLLQCQECRRRVRYCEAVKLRSVFGSVGDWLRIVYGRWGYCVDLFILAAAAHNGDSEVKLANLVPVRSRAE